jgi:hypothetical protein
VLRARLNLHDSEEKIMADSQNYWNQTSRADGERGLAHWRGQGIFAHDDERWLAIGRNHLRIFERLAGPHWLRERPARIVEWGCGGGANAVHFGPGAARYYGIDITQASLTECGRQMSAVGLNNFVPLAIEVSNPEGVEQLVNQPCHLFLSTYVFELLPSKSYGGRLLRIAHRLLEPNGLAFLQIKYSDLSSSSQGYRWNYARHTASMTTYRVEEFWNEAEKAGLQPQVLLLEPEQPLVHDRRYAYFLLQK